MSNLGQKIATSKKITKGNVKELKKRIFCTKSAFVKVGV